MAKQGFDAREHLRHLIAMGTVRHENGEYIGRASDGVEVVLGCDASFDTMLRYLEERPSADRW